MTTVKLQRMSVRLDNLKIHNFQKFLGDSHWIHSTLGVPNYAVNILFKTLGLMSLHSPQLLSHWAREQ